MHRYQDSPDRSAVRDMDVVLRAVDRVAEREVAGSPIIVSRVRAEVGRRLTKERFDRAVIGLQEIGRVVLHHHDFPYGLSEEKRADLVFDPRGETQGKPGLYYAVMARRGR